MISFLYKIEILRALRFKSSYAFLKRPPGDTYMQQWTGSFLAIVCHLFGVKPLPESKLILYQLDNQEQTLCYLNPYNEIFCFKVIY